MQSLPVLMYHYISRYQGSISVDPEIFEAQCRDMARAGWRGVSLAEAEGFLRDGMPLPRKSLLITFDDGFLDNYVYAGPILERYGHKGVIFATTDRLGDGEPRACLHDVWNGSLCPEDLPAVDNPMQTDSLGLARRKDLFLNWEEARRMEASGVMALAAHSRRHLSVFTSPEYSECFFPGNRSRTFFRVATEVLWGMPHFRLGPALSNKAFLPSEALLENIRALVPQDKEGALRFARDAGSQKALQTLLSSFRPEDMGRYETEEEFHARIQQTLQACKNRLESELGHRVDSLCWPWGAWCPAAQRIARDLGFSVFFTTEMGANPPGSAGAVRRFKVRNKPYSWLALRLNIYSRSGMANLYAKMRL